MTLAMYDVSLNGELVINILKWSFKFCNKLVIYSSEGHCWLTPSPCGATNNNLIYYKKGNYNFIEVLK